MLVFSYLLFAIVTAIVVGRIGTICKDYFSHGRKNDFTPEPISQTAK